ncbi:beta-ketoacyl synthase N-terminal-like domain-containing protein, partial [Pelosinus fermentans]
MDINVDNIKMGIKEILMDLLKCSNDFLDAEKSFLEIGINSIQSVELVESINQKLGQKLGIDAVFDYTNINELAGYIFDQFRIGHCDKRISMVGDTEEGFRENNLNCMENAECLLEDFPTVDKLRVIEPEQYQVSHDPKAVPEKKESSISVGERGSDIAIIGISGRFAGAENVEEFWNHLQAGDNCIEEINRKGWDESKYYSPDPGQVDRAVSKWGGLLNNIEEFDALFFNISPLEAERMDPQQRLLLQEAYRVFEDAGYSAEELSGRKVGVFVGGRTSDYKEKTLLTQERNSQTFLGNDMSILAARISYFLNLKGPNIAIDTACSSSLVAIHLACESIHSGRSEMALAGGVFVLSSPEFYVMASKTEMLSPDGQCKTFDNRANGIALGEGVGVLLMKKLEQAVADGDYIYGVIKGSSINQDGKTKGITAPSMLSQKALLYDAYKNAAIHPETVSFIETHGTGTKLGDPIEVKALTEAFQMFTNKSQFCAIGSHKPNFGHAIMSAGIAGVLKVLMAMKYRKLPPQINITEVNEHIDLNKSPFFINRELREWKSRDGGPLRAGVSAFGFSGTNCHAIIEEAPIRKRTSGNAKPCYLFPFSAKTKDALERKIADMIHWFEEKVQNERADEISYTLLAGRSHFSARCIFIAEDLYELQQQLIAVAKSGLAEFSFREEVKGLKDYGEQLLAELREDRSINAETYKEKLSVLSELYISGYTLNWANLFDRSRRVPLPTYPFAREHYWIPDVTSTDHSRVEGAGAFI